MGRGTLRLAALLVVVAAVALSAWLARPAPLAIGSDLDAARTAAKSKGAWVVVHVRRADRPLGAKMDAETLADPEVARRAKDGFVHVRFDAAAEHERVERLAGPGAALATLVLDDGGETVAQLDGFATGPELLLFLERVRARRAELSDPATPKVARAEIVFSLGAVTSAERELATAESAGADRAADAALAPRALLLHGQLELRRGHVEAAAQAFRDVVARYPATPSAGDAERLLGTLAPR